MFFPRFSTSLKIQKRDIWPYPFTFYRSSEARGEWNASMWTKVFLLLILMRWITGSES